MAQILNLRPPPPILLHSSASCRPDTSGGIRVIRSIRCRQSSRSWTSLEQSLKCTPRYSCFFSDNSKQEQAMKALESALAEKKGEYEKWDKQIKRREQAGGGGNSGGRGWFRWFGGSGDDHYWHGFWQEAQQIGLTILTIVVVFLVAVKGDVLLAVLFNPLLFALRGTRNGLTFITSKILKTVSPSTHAKLDTIPEETYTSISAKEKVVRKWGSD